MSALPDDTGSTNETLQSARAALDEAAQRLDALTSQLTERRAEVDRLESLLDAVLELGDTPMVVIDGGRKVTACSRAAADDLGCEVGAALSAVVSAEVAGRIGAMIDEGEAAATPLPDLGDGAEVRVLASGQAILALGAPGTRR